MQLTNNNELLIFKPMSRRDFLGISSEIAFRWTPQDNDGD